MPGLGCRLVLAHGAQEGVDVCCSGFRLEKDGLCPTPLLEEGGIPRIPMGVVRPHELKDRKSLMLVVPEPPTEECVVPARVYRLQNTSVTFEKALVNLLCFNAFSAGAPPQFIDNGVRDGLVETEGDDLWLAVTAEQADGVGPAGRVGPREDVGHLEPELVHDIQELAIGVV